MEGRTHAPVSDNHVRQAWRVHGLRHQTGSGWASSTPVIRETAAECACLRGTEGACLVPIYNNHVRKTQCIDVLQHTTLAELGSGLAVMCRR